MFFNNRKYIKPIAIGVATVIVFAMLVGMVAPYLL